MSNKAIVGQGARQSGQVQPRQGRRGFVQVREPGTNWLLFLYDPDRQLIEIERRGQKTLIDLRNLIQGD